MRERRLQLGVSQEELGSKAGLDRTYVSGLERGRRNPTLKVLVGLAFALRMSPDELMSGAKENLKS